MKTVEYLTERNQSQSVQNPANMMNAMARTARTPRVIRRVRARRDGRPTLIRGPEGPPPRSGIWKAKVRTSKVAVVWSVSGVLEKCPKLGPRS
ncbi:hypothetical protein Slala03_05370 [Streptomyces lavendulae subsp. lavendulae]|nr:hypothetical protein Slala03_05370 [Streptomyces lavendulae subsp. lavendulae]GLV99589.1 hypothetical protein Slala05_32210 [Streptomyces lavendulae subsp. lavendulae]